LQPSQYLDFLEDYLTHYPHQVLMPMEEDTLLLLAQHRERFAHITRFPFAAYDDLLFARDKLKVLRRAEDELKPWIYLLLKPMRSAAWMR